MIAKEIAILLGLILVLPAVAHIQSADNSNFAHNESVIFVNSDPQSLNDEKIKPIQKCETISDAITALTNTKAPDIWTIIKLPESNAINSLPITSANISTASFAGGPNYQLENITKTMTTYGFSGIAAVVLTFMTFGFVGFETKRI